MQIIIVIIMVYFRHLVHIILVKQPYYSYKLMLFNFYSQKYVMCRGTLRAHTDALSGPDWDRPIYPQ